MEDADSNEDPKSAGKLQNFLLATFRNALKANF